MTHIDFHVHAPDKLTYACRLARKAYGAGTRAVFHAADAALLADFDRLLWTFSATDFIPHCRLSVADAALAAETPIHLVGPDDADACVHHDLIVNLDRAQPAFFGRFTRLIDIVGADSLELDAGRMRWKFYKDRGYALTQHEVGAVA